MTCATRKLMRPRTTSRLGRMKRRTLQSRTKTWKTRLKLLPKKLPHSRRKLQNEKKDLAEQHKDLENTLETLAEEIATLKKEVTDMEVGLKQAGINRKEENQLFQQQVADQRATVKVLNMALDRLKEFYTPDAAFAQIRSHQPTPGAAVAAPPPKPGAYENQQALVGSCNFLQKSFRKQNKRRPSFKWMRIRRRNFMRVLLPKQLLALRPTANPLLKRKSRLQ